MLKEQFTITGMTCSACAVRVNKAVAALAGVADVNVNLLKNSLSVSFDEAATSVPAIAAAVAKAGYGALPRGRGETAAGTKETPDAALALEEKKQRLIVSSLCAVPLVLLAMGPMAGLPLPAFLAGPENSPALALTQFLLTLPVLFVHFPSYRTGLRALFSGAPNMDSLIAIGSGAAVVYSVAALYGLALAAGRGDAAAARLFAADLYFDSAAMILTLITLGRFFEARARGKTSEAVARLMDLAPQTATVLRAGVEAVIPAGEVLAGDTLVVKAGESVPVDGVITEGGGFLDESAITGESLPREKQPGDQVTGATINRSGHFLMRATRVGEDTTLARILRLVDEATSSRAPIARLADTISGIFVPAVIAIAVAATAVWLLLGQDPAFALSIGISVLIISCPCALGLATPTAIMVGTGRGAALGILLKSAQAIETARAVDTVVLDKTGTITQGRPVVTDIIPAGGMTAEDFLAVAASLEKLSEHPMGAAIVEEAERRGIALRKVEGFSQHPGRGIAGMLDGVRHLAGNERMLRAEGATPDEEMIARGGVLASAGGTAIYFAREKEVLGLIALADVVKAGSRQAVAELEAMGIEVIMITGDNARTAAAVQAETGIRRALAEVLPQDKERAVSDLQKEGKRVAMVGDGINDAPALARADVGIAVGAGTDIAIESADIVLMKNDLLDVVTAIRLSRAVMRIVRQNLFWAFFYNSIGIPLAAGLFYGPWDLTLNPMVAAAAMSLSSLSVVSNALRLRLFAPEPARAAPPAAPSGQITPRSLSMQKKIRIDGMNCGHCAASVEKALRAVPGVTGAQVDLASGTATVEVDGGAPEAALKTAVTEAGFQVVGLG
ncbi:MAG: heavy metal translocating P-type ATPase [Desulfovibrio sp.]|jgi:Cu2+-exporting ATPase/Cu+-exporting ATPase|nr:heavy metal translocating P-type ATPase [Desulfovibrio sp.]